MSQDGNWYPLSLLPRCRVHCRFRWPGYVVLGAATIDGKGQRSFYEIRGRELVPIEATIDAWQPLCPERFWPLGTAPEPLPIRVLPTLAVIGGVSFSAAEAAAEMEADREAARANPGQDAEPDSPGQWWRDVARVVYQPMGEITLEHGEARIMRALILERSIRMDMARYRTNAAVLADLKTTLADILNEHPGEDWVPPVQPLPPDHADFETVMGWMVEVMPSRREVIVLRGRMQSPPASWVDLADVIGRTAPRARQIYRETIAGLVAAGNRPKRRALARLAELQERNREAKRA